MGAEAVTALAGAVTTSGSYKSIDLTLNKVLLPAVELEGNNLNYFKDVQPENGSSQGRNLVLAGVFVPI